MICRTIFQLLGRELPDDGAGDREYCCVRDYCKQHNIPVYYTAQPKERAMKIGRC